jgi:putative transposase
MVRPYSMDLRERVVRAIEIEGLSCREAAARFDVAPSTAGNWVRRLRDTGALLPGQIGGHRPPKIAGEHRIWLVERCQAGDFTVRGLVKELGDRGLSINSRSVWEFVRNENLTYKKRRWSPANASDRTSRADATNG